MFLMLIFCNMTWRKLYRFVMLIPHLSFPFSVAKNIAHHSKDMILVLIHTDENALVTPGSVSMLL